jgi:tetratricopeptide (TPR) repeat protein
MTRFIFFLLLFCSFSISAQIQNLELLVPKNDKCVLKIFTLDEYGELIGQGSGVLIDSKGIAITNFHVLEGASNAVAISSTGEKYKIEKIIDYSFKNDLVKFKLENPSAKVFPKVNLYPGKILKGSAVFAIGYPKGFNLMGESTVSQGIVSGIRKEELMTGQGEVDSLIQTTAQITHGSSGGGLFDSKGNLIGITQGTFATSAEDLHANLNKAVSVKHIKSLKRNLNFNFEQFLIDCAKTNLYAQGVLAYSQGDYLTAYDLLQQYQDLIVTSIYDPKIWYMKGNCAFHIGRKTMDPKILNLAIDNYFEALNLDSLSVNTRGFVALTYIELKQMGTAFKFANEGQNINPNNAFINYVVGKYYNQLEKREMAIKYFNIAISKVEENESNSKFLSQWYLERAIAYAWNKNDFQSEQDYKKCLYLNSQNLDGLFWYGNFLAIRKRYSEACTQFRILKSVAPNYKMAGYSVDDMLRMYRC